MKRTLLLAVLTAFVTLSFAQAGIGEWNDYQSYSNGKKIAIANDHIYCATSGGLFTYEKSDNSILKLTGANGLSDVGIQTIAYGEESNVVLVAYENSNIDLIYDKEIFNISAIKRKQIPGDKKIYNILFVDQTAYLSCGFGIVAINLEKKEVKDTYYIGNNGSSIVVYDMTSDGQNLFAATEEGIYKAPIDSPNLQDFSNWEHVENIPHANEAYSMLELFNGDIVAAYSGDDFGTEELYRQDGANWISYLPVVTYIDDMQAVGSTLVLARTGQVDLYNQNGERLEKIASYSLLDNPISTIHAKSAAIDADGIVWIADSQLGMIKKQGNNYEQIMPKGPVDNMVFSLYTVEDNLWVSTGGRNAAWGNLWNPAQIQRFSNDDWTTFNPTTHAEISGFPDMVCVISHPNDPAHIYAGSWGGGLIEFQGDEFVERYALQNSSLQTALPDQPDEPYVRVGGMDFDSQGNLWVTNSGVGKPLSVLKTDGSWEAFSLTGISSSYTIGQIAVTENDDQWIVLPRGNNLYVRKADGSGGKRLPLIAYFYNGERENFTPLNDIYSIALDKDGALWLGTTKGVAVFYNPEEIWEHENFYAAQPGLDLNDGIYHPLLETETVTSIAVDGGNRKWFGTKNSGLFLISEDGEHELEHFTESNSPLLSNEITSIAINPKNGEVFIGTPKGLVSYMGEATEGSNEYADVYAYPNPVREDYYGDIVIAGLIENTEVKITDISGNLVYETNSVGGQATWNGKNTFGHRVSTGVYMVFGNDRLGEKTFVTKILFIH
ncbi:type IX secretion system anionic LPS delivery protein PorZ [Sunxiuqinia sp. A32]|uniref:type IX secretion system anionic LPS delivery protein PorZ n=1 Tax=Sunxiuqinia sp. A32 TaxID=3461496 RepID=UPI0040464130